MNYSNIYCDSSCSYIISIRSSYSYQRRKVGSSSLFLAKDADATAARSKDKAAVDSKFLQRITVILKVLVPSPLSAEFAYLVLVAAALMARTYADIYMIQVCNF